MDFEMDFERTMVELTQNAVRVAFEAGMNGVPRPSLIDEHDDMFKKLSPGAVQIVSFGKNDDGRLQERGGGSEAMMDEKAMYTALHNLMINSIEQAANGDIDISAERDFFNRLDGVKHGACLDLIGTGFLLGFHAALDVMERIDRLAES